jgi:CheY-like chemotaxis protein
MAVAGREVGVLTKRIVLVEDAELRRALEGSFFHRAGFALLVAGDAKAALALIEERDPDLVMLTSTVPGGEELCRQLKGDPLLRSTPLLLLVAAGDEAGAQRARAAGCDAVLTRPLAEEQLLADSCRLLGIACRAAARAPVDIPLRCRVGAGKTHSGRALNLNVGGLFATAIPLYPVGTLLDFELLLPGRAAPVCGQARVAWVNHPEWVKTAALPAGMGLEFTALAEGDAALLQEACGAAATAGRDA